MRNGLFKGNPLFSMPAAAGLQSGAAVFDTFNDYREIALALITLPARVKQKLRRGSGRFFRYTSSPPRPASVSGDRWSY
jgi:hypothetical protein